MATTYPLPKFHFLVQWGGVRVGFTEITGLDITVEVIEYREGSSPEYSKIKMPGMHTSGNLTFKRGLIAGDSDFYKWINTISLNKVERRDIIISLLDETHAPVMTWKARNAFPVKILPGDLNSTGNEVAIESIEIAHEGLNLLN